MKINVLAPLATFLQHLVVSRQHLAASWQHLAAPRQHQSIQTSKICVLELGGRGGSL